MSKTHANTHIKLAVKWDYLFLKNYVKCKGLQGGFESLWFVS